MRLSGVWAAALLLGAAGVTYGQSAGIDPIVDGYVTALTADGGYAVQGIPIAVTAKTKIFTVAGKTYTPAHKVDAPYVGEPMLVWGRFDKKTRAITAGFIHVYPPEAAKLAGKGMIDQSTPGGDEERMVRADGYPLKLTSATKMHFNEPLASLKDVGTNQWITYTGVQGIDGVVTVDEAEVWNNRVDPDEVSLRKKREFDPAAVGTDKKQGVISRGTFGIDPKKLPAHQDAELQARVDRIGMSLIPAYQKALPDADPTKINFRFQVVDSDQLHDGWGLASGVVQVPYAAVTRMTTDGELAAVLADHIAQAIEKQALMNAPANFQLKTANWVSGVGSVVAGAFVPGLGLATGLVSGAITGSVAGHIETLAEQQSGRVSLCLLHDAGYDLTSAPMAYWLLAPKKPKPMTEVEVPPHASDLYQMLGTTWRGKLE